MGLIKYSVDGSSLSPAERTQLEKMLDSWSSTGTVYVDIKKGIYQAMFDESTNVNSLQFPPGTIIRPL